MSFTSVVSLVGDPCVDSWSPRLCPCTMLLQILGFLFFCIVYPRAHLHLAFQTLPLHSAAKSAGGHVMSVQSAPMFCFGQ